MILQNMGGCNTPQALLLPHREPQQPDHLAQTNDDGSSTGETCYDAVTQKADNETQPQQAHTSVHASNQEGQLYDLQARHKQTCTADITHGSGYVNYARRLQLHNLLDLEDLPQQLLEVAACVADTVCSSTLAACAPTSHQAKLCKTRVSKAIKL